MATLLGTLPSCCKSEMERHGDGPKPGLTALAEPRKTRNAPKAPASASSADLQATGRDAGSFPSREKISAAASSLPKDSPRGLIRAVELEKQAFFPRTVDPTACRAQSETPAPATPRHPAPPSVPAGRRRGLGYHPRFSKQDACRRSGQRLRMDLQPEPLRASSTHLLRLTQFCALLLSLTFLHRLPGTSMAYRARAGAGILSAVSEARGPEAGGGGAGRRGLLATGLARAVVGTRSCSWL